MARARIKLTAELIRYISVFERLTGATVKDCFLEGKSTKLVFIVNEGVLGLAIGKKGANIKRVKMVLEKELDVIEYSKDPLQFIRQQTFEGGHGLGGWLADRTEGFSGVAPHPFRVIAQGSGQCFDGQGRRLTWRNISEGISGAGANRVVFVCERLDECRTGRLANGGKGKGGRM